MELIIDLKTESFLCKIWGILCAFVLASRVRAGKTERDIQKWTAKSTVVKNELLETKAVEMERDREINYI